MKYIFIASSFGVVDSNTLLFWVKFRIARLDLGQTHNPLYLWTDRQFDRTSKLKNHNALEKQLTQSQQSGCSRGHSHHSV